VKLRPLDSEQLSNYFYWEPFALAKHFSEEEFENGKRRSIEYNFSIPTFRWYSYRESYENKVTPNAGRIPNPTRISSSKSVHADVSLWDFSSAAELKFFCYMPFGINKTVLNFSIYPSTRGTYPKEIFRYSESAKRFFTGSFRRSITWITMNPGKFSSQLDEYLKVSTCLWGLLRDSWLDVVTPQERGKSTRSPVRSRRLWEVISDILLLRFLPQKTRIATPTKQPGKNTSAKQGQWIKFFSAIHPDFFRRTFLLFASLECCAERPFWRLWATVSEKGILV